MWPLNFYLQIYWILFKEKKHKSYKSTTLIDPLNQFAMDVWGEKPDKNERKHMRNYRVG